MPTGPYPPTLRGLASSPCLDPAAVDPEQARDVTRWRRAERARLLAARAALPPPVRQAAAKAMAGHLDTFFAARACALAGLKVSGWWPIGAEPDLRFWLAGLAARGAVAALPVVTARGAPLGFRTWTPATPMTRGLWNIPAPAEGTWLAPDIVLVPLVGWDAAGHRLGHGGGYYDRTLAAAAQPPLAIGIGFACARIATIFPQPHDIAMQAIVTDHGIHTPEET